MSAHFSGRDLRGESFVDAQFPGADVTRTTVVHCDTAHANLSVTTWDGGIGPWRKAEKGGPG